MDTLSVIIPCYNQAHFLPEALASVLAQTYQDWECIIVNDGSPDNTAEVAQEWVEKDSRFHYIEKPNGGLSSARNSGLREARGDFIQFLDADDAIHPAKFELQIAETENTMGMVVVYCDYYYSSEDDLSVEIWEHLSPKLNPATPLIDMAIRWETQLSIPCHCFLFDARLFSEYGIQFDERLSNHEDLDCWMRIFAWKPVLRYVGKKLAIYRIHHDSMCRNRMRMRNGFLAVIDKQQRLLRKSPELVRALKIKRREVKCLYVDCEPLANIRRSVRRARAQSRGTVVALIKYVLPRRWWERVRDIKRAIFL